MIGLANYSIRKAVAEDLESINILANTHKKELGFVRKVTLAHSIDQNEILIAESNGAIVGFVRYHHRQDMQTTLYDIVVSPVQRLAGIGRTLIGTLIDESRILGKQTIVLRCPAELPANEFYARMDFERWHEEPGKRRKLIVWRLSLVK